ncbi:putative RNA-binding Zn ribbon-like protein [Rhizobium sp. BK196]|jgi:predicted RNA-binding Zn ribbon-like protein|uniref:CGNR zinc finger domain-containing protein n=1 Tax=Rhizobium sp. BK196 TaxID=2587073 RepID=UPI001618DD1E|nr:ABATE domain-containing protein [Rhizobium sp. BK196]MBB3311086.1 putative RNA-binding Zn ribbon-like protein [Rhizobium sp. BK196]
MANPSPALFLGDALALDFLNSVATGADAPVDWIEDGEGLLCWLEQAKLVSPETLEAMRAQALPGELDKVADQARNLREWFRTFVREHKGKRLKPGALAELEPLNRLLERDEGYSRVVVRQTDEGEAFEFQPMRKWRSPEALLLPVGEALGRFVCTEDFSNVKACEGQSCTLLFADHTRGHRRRWCSMALCGNRAKQAAHRDRIRQV